MLLHKNLCFFSIALLGALALTACSGNATLTQQASVLTAQEAATQSGQGPVSGATALPTQESPLTPETNPVGDIPDSQVFVSYTASPGNYSLDVPEGWARTTNGSDVRFVDKFDGLSVTLTSAASAPTANSVRQNEVANLVQAGHAFGAGQITVMDLPGGHAVKITATLNSEPDPVTGKQVRLEEDIYLYYHNGTEAMLQLWAPQGADNVDQWKRISESFQWK